MAVNTVQQVETEVIYPAIHLSIYVSIYLSIYTLVAWGGYDY